MGRKTFGHFAVSIREPQIWLSEFILSESTNLMIRTEAGYKSAQEKLEQAQETLQRQREQLEEMDLSEEEVERSMEPMISFRDQLREEIEIYEQM